MVDAIVNYGIPFTYLLLVVATVGAIAAPVLEMLQKPQTLKGAAIGLGLLAVVFGIGYALGDTSNPSKLEITEGTAKMIDTGLYAFYILALISVLATVYSEVSKLIK
jgi:hypothetical protein